MIPSEYLIKLSAIKSDFCATILNFFILNVGYLGVNQIELFLIYIRSSQEEELGTCWSALYRNIYKTPPEY